MMLNNNDKIALVVCSNGKNIEDKDRLEKLESILVEMGLVPIFTKYIYKDKFGRGAKSEVRAEELMSFYKNKEIKEYNEQLIINNEQFESDFSFFI
mgnify:CR=1 FL=1